MPPSKLYEIRKAYIQQCQDSYPEEKPSQSYPSFLDGPSLTYHNSITQDMDLLHTTVSPVYSLKSHTLADYVFGGEMKNQSVNLEHTTHLLSERASMHQKHPKERESQGNHLARKPQSTLPEWF